MGDHHENVRNPTPTIKQRLEMLEGNFEQVLNLLKMLTSNKESLNGNPNDSTSNPTNLPNGTNARKGHNIQFNEDDSVKVVAITPKSH